MKNLILIILISLTGVLFAQENNPGVAKIQTNAECGTCKEKLEGVLNYTKGVKFAELNLIDKTIEVSFKPKKISLDEIRTIISNTGYDADDVNANPKAQDNLPACCKPGGMN